MTLPLELAIVATATDNGAEARRWLPERLFLATAAVIGVGGALFSDVENVFWVKVGLQLAFVASLSLFATSWFRKRPEWFPEACAGAYAKAYAKAYAEANAAQVARAQVRVVSRQIYLLLYVLAGVKLIQFLFRAPHVGPALSEAMHGLLPYFVGALLPLALVRLLASRRHA